MIDLPLLLTFMAAASVLTLTPGVDTAMVLRAATIDGRRSALMASGGIGLGCLAWGGAVSLGLGALLKASELAFTAFKLAGGAYLVWMGWKLLTKPRSNMETSAVKASSSHSWGAFKRGFITNLLNPKVGVFYVTFLPQFVPSEAEVAAYSFFRASIHVLLTLAWFIILVAATVPLERFLRRPAAVKTLDRLTGCVFLGFGFKLATSSAR